MQQKQEREVRKGRNWIRQGHPIKVKLTGKTKFRSGFRFQSYEPETGTVWVTAPNGNCRAVTLDQVQRVAVTKAGERVR